MITTWEDFSVFGFLIDRVGRYQLEEFLDCSYLPLQRILPEVLKEEVGHIGFGTNQTAELAAKNDESRERVQQSVNFWYVKALDMFGRSDSERSNRFCHWGLKRRSTAKRAGSSRRKWIRSSKAWDSLFQIPCKAENSFRHSVESVDRRINGGHGKPH